MLRSYALPKKIRKLTGIFIGEVIQNRDDRDGKRVKVKILGLTDSFTVDKLPYYSLSSPVSDSPNGNVVVPPIGSKVEIELQGDIYNGVVINSATNISPQ